MKKVILFNGPKLSGKDSACRYILEHVVPSANHLEFKGKLFELVYCIYSITPEQWAEMYTRENKEKPYECLYGLSPRQALIKVSEEVIKPNYHHEYFGDELVKKLKGGLNIVSDSGFVQEAQSIINDVGVDNVMVVRIYRPGFTFEGDSRNYLPPEALPGVTFADLHNDQTEQDFYDKVERVVDRFYLDQVRGDRLELETKMMCAGLGI